jgi:hypothetical protein
MANRPVPVYPVSSVRSCHDRAGPAQGRRGAAGCWLLAGGWWCLAACGGLLLGRANTRVSRVLRQTRAHARMDRMPYSTRALVCAVAVWGPVALSSSQDLDDIDIDGGSGSWSGPPKPLPTWSRCEFNSTKGQLPPGDPPKSICPGCNAPDCTCPKGACWPGKNLTHTPDHTCDCFAKLSFCEKGTQPVYTPGEVCPSCWPPENKACMCFAAIGFCEAVPAPAPAPPHPKSTPPPSPPPSDIWSRGAGDRWSPGVSLVIIGLSCGVILAYIVFRKTRGQCDRPDPIQEHLNDQIQQW